MSVDWQTGIALLCVIGAGTVIVRRVIRFLNTKQSGCGGSCSGCDSTNSQVTGGSLVSLTLPSPTADRAGQ